MFKYILQAQLLAIAFLISSCNNQIFKPNWTAIYETKLGQTIRELDETPLNSHFESSKSNLTRIAVAILNNGTTVLLGLPPYNKSPQEVVNRTVVLTETEWKQSCREAIGKEVYGWAWSRVQRVTGNTFTVYPFIEKSRQGLSLSRPLIKKPYCEFIFLR